MHPWHDINIQTSKNNVFNSIVEIPENSKVKYELDKTTGLIKLDRMLYSSMHYPLNYGFFPQTLCEDNDPLDVLIFSQYSIYPGTLVEIYPIGIIELLDNNEKDDKIIAISSNDPIYNSITDISQVSQHKIKEIKLFFEDYKKLENKTTEILGVYSQSKSIEVINHSIKLYKETFENKEK